MTPPAALSTDILARCRQRLERGCAELALDITPEQLRQLLAFLDLLVRWNRAYNLTAVRDPLEMTVKHLLDSLAIRPYLFGATVLDLGTGAGLPGLPLAIMDPERRFWLLDSNGKKIRFVRQAVLELGLENVEPVQARIETYRPTEKFATIVSRAVAAPDVLRVRDNGLLANPGRLLLMRGRHPQDSAPADLPPATGHVHELRVPFLGIARHLIEIRSD